MNTKRLRNIKIVLLIITVLIGIFSNIDAYSNPEMDFKDIDTKSTHLQSSDIFENEIIYSGTQDPIEFNETAINTDTSHFSIGNGTFPEFTSQNAEFPLDETHNWEGYRYFANISNLVDERDWVINGNFGSESGITPSSTQVQYFNYTYGINEKKSTILETFDGNDCNYMRLHFINITIQGWYDSIFIWDNTTTEIDSYSGSYKDFYTPWYATSQLEISMYSDNWIHGDFYIDYFETYNGSFFSMNGNNWTHFGNVNDPLRIDSNIGNQGNHSSLSVSIEGVDEGWATYSYDENDESGVFQEISAPRGDVTDAWIKMDYFLRKGINTDDIYVYFKINNEIIYKRGFRTITEEGLANWQSTGLVNLNYWENNSEVFENPIKDQSLNISFGIEFGADITINEADDIDGREIQQVYFDNVRLILKAEANCTQTNINLELNSASVLEEGNHWGEGTFTQYNSWTNNPIQILMTTDSPKIEFDLDSKIYAFHLVNSSISQYGAHGTTATIYSNGSVHWDGFHNAFIPISYSNYEYSATKPPDWHILELKDPLGSGVSFNSGLKGNSQFSVNYPDSSIPGWWSFAANSTNMINFSSTEIWDGTHWSHYLSSPAFNISDTVRIRTNLLTSLGNIENNASTWGKLIIYDSEGTEWNSSSVHPQTSGLLEFPELTLGTSNSTGGIYSYSITWSNGTSAGGLNGTFEVKRDLQYSLQYPRDAVSDLTTEEIRGDVIPIRLILNDSITGIKQSNLHVEYVWTPGEGSLVEISNGIYDTSLDSLSLGSAGYHEVNFTIWGIGYHNVTFTLTIILVEETDLKIVGLDSNIDYGTNFTVQVRYSSKSSGDGIDGANISVNASSSHFFVSPDVDGTYSIEISSKDAFSGSGSYDIRINATRPLHQLQEIVTRIRILPREVYYEILVNSADCSFNKSYSTHIKEILNFSIGIFSSAEDIPILNGTLYISDGEHIFDDFTIANEYYHMEMNTSHFGLGVHFISIIFNETDYQSASETIMLSISKLDISATLFNTNQTLVVNRKENFEVILYIEDPVTHQPISDANISYSWVFGRGFLSYIEEGKYKFEDISPSIVGSYDIVFTITSINADYEIQTVSVTLVSQVPEGTIKLWWILVPVGAIATIVSIILGFVTYKQKIAIPKQERAVELLRKKTQVFDDITIIKSILIIETGTGRLMYRQQFGGLQEDHEDIFSGFLHSILTLSNRFALRNGDIGEKQEYAEFTHESFNVLVAAGEKIILALILEDTSSSELQERAFKFLDEFEGIYSSILGNWNGDRSIFNKTTPKLFEEIFHLSLLNRFKLTEASNIHIIEKSLISPGTITEQVSQIIKVISEERSDFLLRTLITLIPKEDQLQAKDAILRFIKNKYLVSVE